MIPVLHVQTRAYPTYHIDVAVCDGVAPDLRIHEVGVPMQVARLHSLAYRDEDTLDLDLTELLGQTGLPAGVRLEWARMRVLKYGAVLLTTAYRHEADLTELDRYELCEVDAALNGDRRRGDAEAVAAVFVQLRSRGILYDPRPRLDWRPDDYPRRLVSWGAVRYNAHFFTGAQSWEPDPRVSCGNLPGCNILLPYTYEWVGEDLEAEQVLGLIEPADLAVAQRSVLAGASEQALEILESLSNGSAESLPPVHELRRHIDRVRSTYHRLDSYRYDSAQDARSVYLSARSEMALDSAHERTETVLAQVSESIQSEVNERTMALDGKLNRLAAFFTVATGGALVLDVVEFAGGGRHPALPWRTVILLAVFIVSSLTIVLLMLRGSRTEKAPLRT